MVRTHIRVEIRWSTRKCPRYLLTRRRRTDTHLRLFQDFQCVEGNQWDASADSPFDGNNEVAAAPVASSLPLPPLNLHASMHDPSEEDGDRDLLPPQGRITARSMRHWAQHRQTEANTPNRRSAKLKTLHYTQRRR